MKLLTVVISCLLSAFSTIVMSYIAMATAIGPWIAPTLILLGIVFFGVVKAIGGTKSSTSTQIMYATASGTIGGIVATGMGFSFPTLFFLDPAVFAQWMQRPFFFCASVSGLSITAGGFGLLVADIFEDKFIVRDQLAFPIGELSYKMIAVQDQLKKAYELVFGFVTAGFFNILRDGIALRWVPRFFTVPHIPKSIALIKPMSWGLLQIPLIPFDIWPLLWAIGYVTGHVIMLPLGFGAFSKIFIVNTINTYWFPAIANFDFVLAFGSGMVLAGTLIGMLSTPKTLWNAFKKSGVGSSSFSLLKSINMVEVLVLLLALVCFLTYFKFSPLVQIYLVVFTFICTYQMAEIAGKIGLAQLGRFATFVMVPAMFIFTLNYTQLMLIATFVEISGGVAVDALFGKKMAHLGQLSKKEVRNYQLLGLIISSVCIGIVFWLLINRFGLGTPELFAQRAYSRKLLINTMSFDYVVLALGFVFGYLLKFLKLNPVMVLGGLLMPLNITIGLVTGGLLTLLSKDPERWYPLWSGVFAADSIWMLIKAVM